MSKTFYTPQEVAEELRVTPQTIRNWIKDGTLEARKIGRKWLIPAAVFKRLLEEEGKQASDKE